MDEPMSDEAMADAVDEFNYSVGQMARARAKNLSDLDAKLAILCRLMRDELHPEFGVELLPYLLAQGLRDDLQIILAASESNGTNET